MEELDCRSEDSLRDVGVGVEEGIELDRTELDSTSTVCDATMISLTWADISGECAWIKSAHGLIICEQ